MSIARDGGTTSLTKQIENQELAAYMNWLSVSHPDCYELTFHIANERKTSPKQGFLLKRMGVKPGVPDICMCVPRRTYHALYIEHKTISKSSRLSAEQKKWITLLNNEGYCAVTTRGLDDIISVTEKYLKGFNLDKRRTAS